MARAIIAAAGGALAVTSANRSGGAPAVEACEVSELGLPVPLLIVDGGRAPGGMPSTIVIATTERPEILREGAIPVYVITAALAEIEPINGDSAPAGYDQQMMGQQAGDDSPETQFMKPRLSFGRRQDTSDATQPEASTGDVEVESGDGVEIARRRSNRRVRQTRHPSAPISARPPPDPNLPISRGPV